MKSGNLANFRKPIFLAICCTIFGAVLAKKAIESNANLAVPQSANLTGGLTSPSATPESGAAENTHESRKEAVVEDAFTKTLSRVELARFSTLLDGFFQSLDIGIEDYPALYVAIATQDRQAVESIIGETRATAVLGKLPAWMLVAALDNRLALGSARLSETVKLALLEKMNGLNREFRQGQDVALMFTRNFRETDAIEAARDLLTDDQMLVFREVLRVNNLVADIDELTPKPEVKGSGHDS